MTNNNPPPILYDPDSILYDPASPNSHDPFECSNASSDPSPPPQSTNPKFLDLDDPGPSANLTQQPLSYEDPSTSGPLKEALLYSKAAANRRATEAETLFGPIASILDQHYATIPQLPDRQANALRTFRDELVEIASKHFEAYVRGTPAPPNKSSKNWHIKTSSKDSNLVKSPAQRSPEAVKSGSNKTPIGGKNNDQNTKRQQQPKELSDDRLFLRLSNDNPLRAYSGFALFAYIKSKLGPDNELIKDVLPTKTGFALCPSKGNMKALEEKISAGKICADVPIDKASPWISYRISNVPRNFGTIDDNFQHILAPVTSDSISEAITSAAGARPVSITPSKDNAEFPDLPSTTWIVRCEGYSNLVAGSSSLRVEGTQQSESQYYKLSKEVEWYGK